MIGAAQRGVLRSDREYDRDGLIVEPLSPRGANCARSITPAMHCAASFDEALFHARSTLGIQAWRPLQMQVVEASHRASSVAQEQHIYLPVWKWRARCRLIRITWQRKSRHEPFAFLSLGCRPPPASRRCMYRRDDRARH